ncbi:MAG: hypothetical protein ACRDN8_01040 [Thermoleophilaceae bacterium]
MFVGRKRLARIDRQLNRGDELMESIREELRLTREVHERQGSETREMHERFGRETREMHERFGREMHEHFSEEMHLTREMQEQHQAALEREFELNRAEHELNRREHQQTRAAVQNLRDVCRTLVVQIEENTQTLRDLRGEIRAQTEGLMHVLDELRGRGPGGEPAAS